MRGRRSVWKFFVIFNILTRLLNHRKWGKCHFSKGLWRRRRKLASRTGLQWGNSCTLQCVKYSVCDLRFAVLQCVLYSVCLVLQCLVFRVQWSPQCELQHLATSCCSKNMICAKLIAMNAAHICAVNNVQFNVQWGNTTSIVKHSLLPSKNTLLPQNLRVRCEAGVLCTLNILGNQCEFRNQCGTVHNCTLSVQFRMQTLSLPRMQWSGKWEEELVASQPPDSTDALLVALLAGQSAHCSLREKQHILQQRSNYTVRWHCALHWLQVAVTSAVASDDAQQWVAS